MAGKNRMKRLAYPQRNSTKSIIIAITFIVYGIVLTIYNDKTEISLEDLAFIPVIGAGWYFGIGGGILVAVSSILFNQIIPAGEGSSFFSSLDDPSTIIDTLTLIFTAFVVGRLATVTRERHEALLKVKDYEQERIKYSNFLERLNKATGTALEADSLDSTLKILAEGIGKLFKADDCFFSLWDEIKGVPVPVAAHGSMSDIYPHMQFEPGEKTLTVSVMEAGHPIAVADLEDSPHISSKIAALFPSRSMIGLPLIVQERKLGALLLGYNERRPFAQNEIDRVKITAEQVALVLSKALLLEEERKQVRQLKALHDVAQISTQVDSEDELIERVTDIIGRNIFPDNFGILTLDETGEMLHPHPSYRFFASEEIKLRGVPLGEGVTGQVAKTGKPLRIDNVRRITNYLDVDERTGSELCVPIKFKEQLLGVINAESVKRNGFTEDDERLLMTLAGQLATAMEQLRKSRAERQWLDQLARSNDLIYSLAHVTTHMEKALSQDEIILTFGTELEKMNLTCILAVYENSRRMFETRYTSLDLDRLQTLESKIGVPLIHYTFPLEQYMKLFPSKEKLHQPAIIIDLAEEVQLLFINNRKKNYAGLLKWVGLDQNAELFRLPLLFEDNLLGILWIWGKGLTIADLPVLSIFSKQISVSLERARLFEEVQSLALTDPLTGLNNRRSLFELGRIEFARSIRMNRPFCSMMLDLDHFKQINDTHGHLTGDRVLQEFASRCRGSIREIDLLGRYGGEELIILMPETDLETAKLVAERLRKHIVETPFTISNCEINITVSIGVAHKDANTVEFETLIARADQAMYIAKHKGRNRVAVSV